jgi:hypothetical protein
MKIKREEIELRLECDQSFVYTSTVNEHLYWLEGGLQLSGNACHIGEYLDPDGYTFYVWVVVPGFRERGRSIWESLQALPEDPTLRPPPELLAPDIGMDNV